MKPDITDPDNRYPWEDADGSAPSQTPDPCIGCGAPLLPENRTITDGCPCNHPRGINHGLVPKNTCTCQLCDPAGTGSTRYSPPSA